MRLSAEVTQRLALIDPKYRYGLGYIPGHGLTFFLCKFVNGDKLQRNPENRGVAASLAWDMGQRLIGIYGLDGEFTPVPDGYVPFLVSWPGQSWGNQWVSSGAHASWLEYNGVPFQVVQEDIRLGAIQNGFDIGSAVEDATDYAMDQSDYYAKKHWQTDTVDRTVTREEMKEASKGRAVARLQRTLDGLDVKGRFAQQLLWEQGMGRKPRF
jgi:hypothetical protein